WHYLWALTTQETFARASADDIVYQLALSPRGDRVAAVCKDGGLYLFDARSLARRAKIATGHGEVNGVAYSPDGGQLATVGDDGFLRIWDVGKRALVREWPAHDAKAYNVCYFAEGRKLATCGEDPTIRLWDAATGQSDGVLAAHEGFVEAIAISPSGDLLASAGEDKVAIVWDLKEREPRTRLKAHTGKLSSVAFSPDGKWLATGGQDTSVCLWRHAVGRLWSRGYHHDAVQSLAFTRDGRLVVGDRGGSIRTYRLGPKFPETAAGDALESAEDYWLAHAGRVWSLALLAGDDQFLSVGGAGKLRAWGRDQTLVRPAKPDDDDHYFADFSCDGSHLFAIREREGIEAFDAASGKLRFQQTVPGLLWDSLAVLPGREQVAAASQSGEIAIWNWRSKNQLHLWKVGQHAIQRMAYSPAADRLAAISYAREDVQLIDPNTGEQVASFPAPNCTDCAFSPDGRRLAVDTLNQLAIFDLETRERLHLSPGHSMTINSLAYSPDGRTIATASSDRTVRLWTDEGKPLARLSGHAAAVLALAFTPDGKSLLTGAEDGRLKVYHLATRRELIDMATGFKCISRLSIAPGGRQIAIIGNDWELGLIDIPQRGEEQ
ncbi:MAG: WD40 repeat domain-containing protein, partial [Pirellulaceae bacterium]